MQKKPSSYFSNYGIALILARDYPGDGWLNMRTQNLASAIGCYGQVSWFLLL